MEEDIEDFDDLWFNNMGSVEVFDIPDVPKKILVNNAPKSEEEFRKLISETNEEIEKLLKKSKPKLREYQNTALKKWINNGYHEYLVWQQVLERHIQRFLVLID